MTQTGSIMPNDLSVNEVFTPNDTPIYTYVDRAALKLEERLSDNLKISKIVISISGPSKSGKTVLARKVIDPDMLITVSGAAVKQPDDLWTQVLHWMGAPSAKATTTQKSFELGGGASASGEAGIPLVTKGKAGTHVDGSIGRSSSATRHIATHLYNQVIVEIGKSDFIVFIDDFHYIPTAIQVEVGRQIKSIVEQGVRICAASVPHRSDDVVRSNPELSGRIASINIDYWSATDLKVIAQKGSEAMNVALSDDVLERLSQEAFGTPQLMQSLCLNLFLELGIKVRQHEMTSIDVAEHSIASALERTSDFSDYSSVVRGLHSGPKERGTERKQFSFADGSVGDVYRCILLAISSGPPHLSFKYDDIVDRVRDICRGAYPAGSSVTQALSQMDSLSKSLSPNITILEWSEDVLDIVDPYFLFYLRCSRKLDSLAQRRTAN